MVHSIKSVLISTLNTHSRLPNLCRSYQPCMCLNSVACLTGQLNSLGVIKHFADVVGGKLVAMNLGWQAVFGLLNVCYFALHYMFASQTAHVGALYSAFLAMMLAAGEAVSLEQHGTAVFVLIQMLAHDHCESALFCPILSHLYTKYDDLSCKCDINCCEESKHQPCFQDLMYVDICSPT